MIFWLDYITEGAFSEEKNKTGHVWRTMTSFPSVLTINANGVSNLTHGGSIRGPDVTFQSLEAQMKIRW